MGLALGAGALALAALLVSPAPGRAAPLTEAERRGRAIYLKGLGPAGRPISALVGATSTEIPASAVPCAGCHGHDGRGREEGGVTAPDITWDELTKPYGHQHPAGRRHPPYTGATLARTILHGLDPAGGRLAAVMPRYRMTQEDLADLVAYLQVLGRDDEPGVTAASVRLGTILPAGGALGGLGRAVEGAVRAYLDEVNASGGVYGRRLEVVAEDSARASRLLESGDVFALVAPLFAGDEARLASLVERHEIPAVGPLTPFPRPGSPPGRYVFYVLPGVAEQTRALVRSGANRLPQARLTVVYPDRPELREVVEAVEAECRAVGWPPPVHAGYRGPLDPQAMAAALRAHATDAAVFLGSGKDARALLDEAGRTGWSPRIWLPGSFVTREVLEVPVRQRAGLTVAWPIVPPGPDSPAGRAFRALAVRHGLPAAHVAAQTAAIAAARIVVEGLKLAGRSLRREALVDALERLRDFDAGLAPPVTFGPNRRVGARGAYLATTDPATGRPVPGGWVELPE